MIRPCRCMASSTMISFSTLCRNRSERAASSPVPGGAVTRFSWVMISPTGVASSISKRQSRLVRMPTTFSPSTIGSPEMLCEAMISRASPMVARGERVTGSRITPLAERLTLSTSAICPSSPRLRWITPRPPSRARATASSHSVTVSMAAEIRGRFSATLRETRVRRSTSDGRTSEWQGTRRTSSNVSPSVSSIRSESPLRRAVDSRCPGQVDSFCRREGKGPILAAHARAFHGLRPPFLHLRPGNERGAHPAAEASRWAPRRRR